MADGGALGVNATPEALRICAIAPPFNAPLLLYTDCNVGWSSGGCKHGIKVPQQLLRKFTSFFRTTCELLRLTIEFSVFFFLLYNIKRIKIISINRFFRCGAFLWYPSSLTPVRGPFFTLEARSAHPVDLFLNLSLSVTYLFPHSILFLSHAKCNFPMTLDVGRSVVGWLVRLSVIILFNFHAPIGALVPDGEFLLRD